MAFTLSTLTLTTAGRTRFADTGKACFNSGTLRFRNSTTVLTTFNLAATAFGGASSGVLTLAAVSNSTASAGTNTVPDNYQILASDATVLGDGVFSGTPSAITSGDTIALSSYTLTMPASP
jgi:hypothetical protein